MHGLAPLEAELVVENGKAVDISPEYVRNLIAQVSKGDVVGFLQSITVEARFDQVARLIDNSWEPPCYSTLEIEYDPTYGYVTHIETDSHGRLNSYYTGSCHPRYGCPISPDYDSVYAKELRLTEPLFTPTVPISMLSPIATSSP